MQQLAFLPTQRKRLAMNSEIEDIEDDEQDDDILIRMQHDNGTIVTFISAPSSVFEKSDVIDPMIFWLGSESVFVAINEDLLNEMIEESIEKNDCVYKKNGAVVSPIIHAINIGLIEVSRQIAHRGDKNKS